MLDPHPRYTLHRPQSILHRDIYRWRDDPLVFGMSDTDISLDWNRYDTTETEEDEDEGLMLKATGVKTPSSGED